MSPKKRKSTHAATIPSDLQDAFDAINDIIIRVKPKLSDARKTSSRGSLIDDLHKLAALGQAFTEKRPRSNKNWGGLADALDREGVHLWNTSGLIRQNDGNDDRQLFAALRLAAFRLIEAGLEQKPGIETLIHVLQLASKTGVILSEIGKHDIASSVLQCAAKYEELLRDNDDMASETGHDQTRAQAVILYYCSRMQAAAREGNDAIAHFMLEKITKSDDERLSFLPAHDREVLAANILDIGKTILKSASKSADIQSETVDGKKPLEAVKWIQSAFTVVEKTENSATPGLADLKQTILRSLARAYFLSSSIDHENLVRAETTLQELITSLDSSNSDQQQLRWMHLAVLKRQRASDSSLLKAFKSIVDDMNFDESDVTDILQELRTFIQQHALVADILQHCLQRSLSASTVNGRNFADRFFISIIIHVAKDQDHDNALRTVAEACKSISGAEFELEKVPSAACLTLLWQCGDRQYHARKWSQAADWFLAGTHRVFKSMSDTNHTKCLRKAALCYIEEREFAHASTIIRRCPEEYASTYYLMFLTAARQGLEDEAIRAIEGMVKAPDFDKKMLLLATQLAHEADLKLLLLAVLEALLKTVRMQAMVEAEAEAVVLIRCIIRLVLRLMMQPTADQRILQISLVRHFRTAISLVGDALSGKQSALVIKDVSWLWRTAYNTAVQGCLEWEDAEEEIADTFDSAYELIQAYSKLTVSNTDAEPDSHLVFASFAALSARVFALRNSSSDSSTIDQKQLRTLQSIERCKQAISSVNGKALNEEQIDSMNIKGFLHIAIVFQIELLCERNSWEDVLEVVKEVTQSNQSMRTFEAIADIVWVQERCPVQVLYTILETILHTSLDHKALSLVKFSRWVRSICTILLSQNSSTDRTKAINYIEQALNVIDGHSDSDSASDVYPMDERYWLLSTAYNTGVECLAASYLDEAKRWFESATVVCRFVPDGQRHSEKISATYQRLLERYTSDNDGAV